MHTHILKSWLNRTDDILNHGLELCITFLSQVIAFDSLSRLVLDNLWHRNSHILSLILSSVGHSSDIFLSDGNIHNDWLWFCNDNCGSNGCLSWNHLLDWDFYNLRGLSWGSLFQKSTESS